jgi:cupin fold WbuC family metalloprotein
MGNAKTFASADIPTLIKRARAAVTRRDRILMHASAEDPIQEMIVALMYDSVVKPHLHPLGSESYYALSGTLEILWGPSPDKLTERVILDATSQHGPTGLRLETGIWHTTRALTDCAVYLEIGKGPFNDNKTVYAADTTE